MKKILFLITLIPIVFIGSSCSSGGGDGSGGEECTEDSLVGSWELKSQIIEFYGCPDTNDFEDEDILSEDNKDFFVFDDDNEFDYHIGFPDEDSDCSGLYDVDVDCDLEIGFAYDSCSYFDALAGQLEDRVDPLALEFNGDYVTIIAEFDLSDPDGGIPEGCSVRWEALLRHD